MRHMRALNKKAGRIEEFVASKTEDVVAGQPFSFSGGALAVPDRPGLGV